MQVFFMEPVLSASALTAATSSQVALQAALGASLLFRSPVLNITVDHEVL